MTFTKMVVAFVVAGALVRAGAAARSHEGGVHQTASAHALPSQSPGPGSAGIFGEGTGGMGPLGTGGLAGDLGGGGAGGFAGGAPVNGL